MILWSSGKLGAPLLATLLFLQTGCLCLISVYADFESENGVGDDSTFEIGSSSNHYEHHLQHVSQRVTQQQQQQQHQQGYYIQNEPYLVTYDDDDEEDDEKEDELVVGENGENRGLRERVRESIMNDGGSSSIFIQDFVSMSSSKVVLKVKDRDDNTGGGVEGEYDRQAIRYSSIDDNTDDATNTTIDASNSDDATSNSVDAYNTVDEITPAEDVEGFKKAQTNILNMLGMKSRPKRKEGSDAAEKKEIPKKLIDLYNKQTNSELLTSDLFLPGKLTRNANTVRVVNPVEISFLNQSSGALHATLKFDLSPPSIPANEQITGAELRVPFSVTIPSPSDHAGEQDGENVVEPSTPPVFVRVLLHDVVRPQMRKQNSQKSHIIPDDNQDITSPWNRLLTHVIDAKLVNLTNRKYSTFWLTFDLLPAVLRWMSLTGNKKNPKSGNYGVALEIVGLKGEKPEEIQGCQAFNMKLKEDTHSVNLFLYSDDGHNAKARRARSKRAAGIMGMTANINSNRVVQRKLRRATDQHHYNQQQQYYRNQNQHYHRQSSGGGGGRRRKPHRHKNKKRNLCSKKPMFVDFTDVGWNDWIVAPPGYQAYYCSGECPFPMAEHLNATNHAVIQALINSMNPGLVPPPCCVPNSYSSLSLLYTDSTDKIVLKNYNEMIVDSCGCS